MKHPVIVYALLLFVLPLSEVTAQSTDKNSVKSITYLEESSSNSDLVKIDSVFYYDGLGRQEQLIAMACSPLGKDIVQPVKLDGLGRNSKQYLPFIHDQTDGDFVNFQYNFQEIFYNSSNNHGIVQTPKAFGEIVYEKSSLNRPKRQSFPGQDWQLDDSDIPNEKTVKSSYNINLCSDAVIMFGDYPKNIPATLQFPVYPEGQLIKNSSFDEHGMETQVFTDKQGQTILVRKLVPIIEEEPDNPDTGGGGPRPTRASQSNADFELFDTYSNYDDFGNLVAVIQPEGSALFTASDCGSNTLFEPYFLPMLQANMFVNHYDARQRLIAKKSPSTYGNTEYFVYDKLDRLRFSTNEEMLTNNQWNFTKYDIYGRGVVTGLFEFNLYNTANYSTTAEHMDIRDALQATMDFDDSQQGFYEYEDLQAADYGYTNQTYPQNDTEVLTVNYYDDYHFADQHMSPGAPAYQFENNSPYSNAQTRNEAILNLPTASKAKVLDPSFGVAPANQWLCTVNYYDHKYRLTQSASNNHLGGKERMKTKYDFVGKPILEKHEHNIPNEAHTVIRRHEYDHAQRLTNSYLTYDSDDEVVAYTNEYNEIGQLIRQRLHQVGGGDFPCYLQDVDYRYNERGWLTDINDIDELKLCAGGDRPITRRLADATLNSMRLTQQTRQNPMFAPKAGETTETDKKINIYTGRDITTFADLQPILGIHERDSIINIALEEVITTVKASEGIYEITDDEQLAAYAKSILDQKLARLDRECSTINEDLFAQRIGYNTANSGLPGPAQYNGNIANIQWVNSDRKLRGYGYTYDACDRLTKAVYNYTNSHCTWGDNTQLLYNRYGVQDIEYDKNGNILQLSRNGKRAAPITFSQTYGQVDALFYKYYGNVLVGINDPTVANNEGIGDFRENTAQGQSTYLAASYEALLDYKQSTFQNTGEYEYDRHGNMTHDRNKGIEVAYNHLNLPTSVRFDNAQTIQWIYDATGRKLAKKAPTPQNPHYQKHYIGPFEYVLKKRVLNAPINPRPTIGGGRPGSRPTTNGGPILTTSGPATLVPIGKTQFCLEAYYHEVGRVTPQKDDNNDPYWEYEYTIKDHLGNSRATFADTDDDTYVDRLQENQYYPYGLSIADLDRQLNGDDNKYQYNGKELEDDYNLAWNDYGFRRYDPQIARWHNNDPLTHAMPSWSGYNYTFNNPVRFIDPDGTAPTTYKDEYNNTLFVSKDGLDDRVVIIKDSALETFNTIFEDAITRNKNLHGDSFNRKLRKLGDNYLIEGMVDFYNATNTIIKSDNYEFEDGTPLYGFYEHMSIIYQNDEGAFVIGGEKFTSNDVFTVVGYSLANAESDDPASRIHSHNEISGKIRILNPNSKIYNQVGAMNLDGNFGPSWSDKDKHIDNKKGVYNIVITSSNIYFYNGATSLSNTKVIDVPLSNFEK